MNDNLPPQKSRSILNLTASALSGIYSPTGYEPNRDEALTPWGTGAQTPARSTSVDVRKGFSGITQEAFKEKEIINRERQKERRKSIVQHQEHWRKNNQMARVIALVVLFCFGVAYGEVITQLHNSGHVAPVQINQINRSSWIYLVFWGTTGVTLGVLLPLLDRLWRVQCSKEDDQETSEQAVSDDEDSESDTQQQQQNRLGTDWSDIVRSVGAFVGIAFAIVGDDGAF